MPLYSVLIRDNFPIRILGTLMRGTGMAGGLGMATGPFLGGWIFDRTGGYGALYIASCAIGVGACLIAMLFRPFPVAQASPPQPQPAPQAACHEEFKLTFISGEVDNAGFGKLPLRSVGLRGRRAPADQGRGMQLLDLSAEGVASPLHDA